MSSHTLTTHVTAVSTEIVEANLERVADSGQGGGVAWMAQNPAREVALELG